ncbi:MAG: UDP-glucose/GDP-mannose dehydrogenase family protein [Puniceicoccales bacterium]|jgi:UDPglucose 6-dehydrogenase|nr:UDP-glucose/GDP-mannose dehydrogenase family protein [Puniceicoccales bacterium]
MKITIIGTGYVGLFVGCGFSELGYDVICVDKVPEKIADLNAGKVILFEDGLDELFRKNVASGKLKFTVDTKYGVESADFIIITVGTPLHSVTKEANVKYLYAAIEEIAPYLSGYTVIANKSTVPVGTGDKLVEIIKTINPAANFDVISMPEFLREGLAIHDFFHPDRVVVGTDSMRAQDAVKKLFSPFQDKPNILFVERRSAELIKYASNAFLAVKVHYINEIADFCEKVGANVYDVAKGVGLDSRIGDKFLNPGPGYGGSCFPKDTNALVHMARHVNVNLSLVEATIAGNDARKSKMATRISDAIKDIENPKIAVWGLAFKNGTDDVRESPAIQIVQKLVSHGIKITAYDPKAMETAHSILGNSIAYADSAVDAAKDTDALAILTEWPDFKDIPLAKLQMRHKRIVDLRHMVDAHVAMNNGFDYEGIGK